jgi:hypothetical protein
MRVELVGCSVFGNLNVVSTILPLDIWHQKKFERRVAIENTIFIKGGAYNDVKKALRQWVNLYTSD